MPVKERGMRSLARHEPGVFTGDEGMSISLIYFVIYSNDKR